MQENEYFALNLASKYIEELQEDLLFCFLLIDLRFYCSTKKIWQLRLLKKLI
jgi:hypothetical protein